jgi:hypothetical protein
VVRVEIEPDVASALSAASGDLRSVTRANDVQVSALAGQAQPRVQVEPLTPDLQAVSS